MIQLASSSVSCRQSRPFGFRFWGGTSWLSTSRLEAAVCLVSVGCLLLRLSSGVGDGPRGGVCGFLAHRGFACLCRGKWRLKVRQATMLSFAAKSRRKCRQIFQRTDENLEESLATKSLGSSFLWMATAWIKHE